MDGRFPNVLLAAFAFAWDCTDGVETSESHVQAWCYLAYVLMSSCLPHGDCGIMCHFSPCSLHADGPRSISKASIINPQNVFQLLDATKEAIVPLFGIAPPGGVFATAVRLSDNLLISCTHCVMESGKLLNVSMRQQGPPLTFVASFPDDKIVFLTGVIVKEEWCQ